MKFPSILFQITRFMKCCLVGWTLPLAATTDWDYSAYHVEDTLSFEILKLPLDHQGPQVIDLRAAFLFEESIGPKQFPDFEVIYAEIQTWLAAYPHKSDYWEVLNRALCRYLLESYPMVREVAVDMVVAPTYGIQYPHTSRCVMRRRAVTEERAE